MHPFQSSFNYEIHISKVAAGFSDGSASTFLLDKDDNLQVDHRWTEARLHAGQRYVGLTVSERFVLVTRRCCHFA